MSNKRTLGRGLHSLIPEVEDNEKKIKNNKKKSRQKSLTFFDTSKSLTFPGFPGLSPP